MFLAKAKLTTALLLAVSLLTGGAGVLTHQALAGKPGVPQETTKERGGKANRLAPKQERAKLEATPSKDGGEYVFRFSGRVVDPAGNPVPNARVYLLDSGLKTRAARERARTNAEGRYLFVEKSEFDRRYSAEPWNPKSVLAFAEDYGLGVPQLSVDKSPATGEVTIHLSKDDVPIIGRVIDLHGKPVAGVQVRVRGIQLPKDGDMVAFIDTLKANKEGIHPQVEMLTGFHDDKGGWNLDSIFPPTTTDAAGRFIIRGVGRERMVDLLIQGTTIETRYVYAIRGRASGSRFRHVGSGHT